MIFYQSCRRERQKRLTNAYKCDKLDKLSQKNKIKKLLTNARRCDKLNELSLIREKTTTQH